VFGNPLVLRKTLLAFLALSVVFCYAPAGRALDFGNMMNPGQWFGGDRDDDYWDDGRYGYGAPPYGPPPPLYGYGAPGMAPPYGYGPAPMGAAPGYGAPTQAQSQESTTDPAEELATLKERVRQLEEAKRQESQPPPPTFAQPAYGAASPGDKHQAPGATATSQASGPRPATYPYLGDSTKARSVMDPSQAVFRPWNQD